MTEGTGTPQDAASPDPAGEAGEGNEVISGVDGVDGVDGVVEEGAPLQPGDLDQGQDQASAPDETARQLEERTGDLQRLQAEFLNYKRRVDRDRDLVRENATFTVLNAMLPVLDDIDRAREHGEVEGGFKAVADSLDRVVAGLGLTRFGTPGDAFDPNLHEALAHGHSAEVTTTSVEHVAQAGYRIGERVVRPARVTVLDPE